MTKERKQLLDRIHQQLEDMDESTLKIVLVFLERI